MKKIPIFLLTGTVLFIAIILIPVFIGGRPLTEEEKGLLEPLYKQHVEFDNIKIKMGGPLTLVYPGVTIGNIISFPKNEYTISNKKDQALLVHEVCHVWQYQHFGLDYIPRSIWELITQNDTYVVHFDSNKKLRSYDVEEQCEIMADIFLVNKKEYAQYLEDLRIHN